MGNEGKEELVIEDSDNDEGDMPEVKRAKTDSGGNDEQSDNNGANGLDSMDGTLPCFPPSMSNCINDTSMLQDEETRSDVPDPYRSDIHNSRGDPEVDRLESGLRHPPIKPPSMDHSSCLEGKSYELPTRPIDLETVSRMRAIHNKEMDYLKSQVAIQRKEIEELHNKLALLDDWRATRGEGMLKKGYALYCYIRDNGKMPDRNWFRTASYYKPAN